MAGLVILSPAVLQSTVLLGGAPNSITAAGLQTFAESSFGLASRTITGPVTLALADRGTRLRYDNAGTGGTVSIPTNATVAFAVGTIMTFFQVQASPGQLTVAGLPGVAVLKPDGGAVATRAQYSHIWIIQDSVDVWIAGGDLA